MTDTSGLETKARQQVSDLSQKAKEVASEKVRRTVDSAQSQTAAEVQATADAAQAASRSFEPGSMQAQATDFVAAQLADAAHRVRTVDLEETAAEVVGFARRNPLIFIGAAALAGFAATRFMKATAEEPARLPAPMPQDPYTRAYPTEEETSYGTS
ncbi:hypothetical protein [Cognatishimia maritima]|uniref:Uncharacterized protein n=1 Tax=Cognatishimia maritima TaxID=870908 RepID=A0A1M5PKQ6_9RHOB|nr:hypothetical protein [Cognatishimia maritima]SHH02355.1 hypothetical protein SAMN04488044_1854 [Cognatishimia maritima]